MQVEHSNRPKILLVDDSIDNLIVLRKMLAALNLNMYVASQSKKALMLTQKYDFQLVLLDIKMPEIDGYEVCKRLRATQKYKDVPILFVSSLHSIEDKIKAFQCGGDDYLVKPLYHQELRARVMAHLQHQQLFASLKHLLKQSYHELYNPLSVINTSAELFKLKYGDNSYIDAIVSAARTLEIVYQDFSYSFSSRCEEHERVDLRELILERISYFKLMAKVKGLEVKLKAPKKVVEINMVKNELLRIIDNTLSNAIKYSFADSQIDIEIVQKNKEILLKCSNVGNSIENLECIFKEGYREDTQQIGMGIGLDLVASICSKNNINYSVASNNGLITFSYLFKI